MRRAQSLRDARSTRVPMPVKPASRKSSFARALVVAKGLVRAPAETPSAPKGAATGARP